MGWYIEKKPTEKSITLHAEIKDRFYADVDQWHFVTSYVFETKEQFKKSLENGSYIVNRVLTDQEYKAKGAA